MKEIIIDENLVEIIQVRESFFYPRNHQDKWVIKIRISA